MRMKKGLSLLLASLLILAALPINMRFAQAAVNELDAALNVQGGTLSFINDAINPWLADSTSAPGRTAAASHIAGIGNGSTTITLNAGTLMKDKVLTFDWDVSSEVDKDTLYFIVNGTPNKLISGLTGTWSTVQYVVPNNGNYTFKWTYQKDNAVNSGLDTGLVDNVKIGDYVHVENVIVMPEVSPVYISFTTQLTATIVPADATNQKITWASSDIGKATVNQSGLVTGVAQGEAYITAISEDGLLVGEGRINVQPPVQTTGVSLNISQGVLLAEYIETMVDGVETTTVVGDTGTLIATITPALASYRTISWSTSNADVATVNSAGKVTAKGEGMAVIRAQTQTGGFQAFCQVTVVKDADLQAQTALTYTPVTVGSTMPVTFGWNTSAYIRYSRPPLMPATTAKGFELNLQVGKKITFETSGSVNVDTYLDLYLYTGGAYTRVAYDDDEGAASFSKIFSFIVPQTGTYRILVSGYSYTSKGTFNLTVSEVPPIPVTGVEFNQDTFSVPLNYTLPVPYSVLPADADFKGVTFTSGNEDSITVNAAGEVTGVSPGSSVITVTTNQGGFTDTCLVSVGYIPVSAVKFDTDAVIIGLNKTKTLLYSVLPANAQLKGVSFTSSNHGVATVNAAGIVTATGLGSAVITATTADGGKTDTCSVKVVEVNISTCASVTLVAGDVWGDGSGYQLLFDADADAYGRLFQKSGALNVSGDVPDSVYNQFEYKIPENANGVLTTPNIIVNNSATILIPAGVYDFCIANPVPGEKVWVADTNFTSPGRYNNFNFEAGYSYTFVMTSNNSPIPSFLRDVTTLTASYTGAGLSKYNVSFSVTGTGGTLSGKTQLLAEEGYTLTAADIPVPTPTPGYKFTGWNTNPVGTTLNASISFTASFAINTYRVIFKDWNNTVLKVQENVPHGTAATPPVSPNTKPDYHFTGWSPDYLVITGNVYIFAQYAINTYAVNLPSGEGFTVSLYGQSVNPVPWGGRFTFTVSLSPNYSNSVIVVKSNGTTLPAVSGVYTIDNVTVTKNVTVTGVVLNNAVYTALDAAIAIQPPYPDTYYTDTSINAFRNAQTAGQGIARNLNILSQPAVDNATAAILAAYNALVYKPASYATLDAILLLTPQYNDIYYTAETIAAFRNAITAGQLIARDLNITQQSIVDNAATAINTALSNLVLRPAQTQLILNGLSSLEFNDLNDSITGLSLQNNNAANILAQFDNAAIISIIDDKGIPLAGTQPVGTGAVINLLSKDGTVVDSVTVIVYGDIDGNGLADGMDATLVSLIAAGMLTQAQVGEFIYSAADVNRDGLINGDDVDLLEQAGLFLVTIS